jgi:hypothetical protein
MTAQVVEQEDTSASRADAHYECESSSLSLGTISAAKCFKEHKRLSGECPYCVDYVAIYDAMTDEEKEAQRRSFAYGNLAIENPDITREDIDRAAERLDKKHWYFITCDYCPVCSRTETYRERRYDTRPEKWEDRHELNERYCNCPL